MKVLIVNFFRRNEQGDRRFEKYCNIIKEIITKQEIFFDTETQIYVRNNSDLNDVLVGRSNTETKRNWAFFSTIDFVFMEGDSAVYPWHAHYEQALTLLRMCIECQKKCFVSGGLGNCLILLASDRIKRSLVNGTQQSKVHVSPNVPTLVEELQKQGNVIANDYLIDSSSGDVYQFAYEYSSNPLEKQLSVVERGNLGIHREKHAEDNHLIGKFVIKSHMHRNKQLYGEKLVVGKRSEELIYFDKKYCGHFLLRGTCNSSSNNYYNVNATSATTTISNINNPSASVPLQMRVNIDKRTWNVHAFSSGLMSSSPFYRFDIFAESEKSKASLIRMQANPSMFVAFFHIESTYSNSVDLLRNFINEGLTEMSTNPAKHLNSNISTQSPSSRSSGAVVSFAPSLALAQYSAGSPISSPISSASSPQKAFKSIHQQSNNAIISSNIVNQNSNGTPNKVADAYSNVRLHSNGRMLPAVKMYAYSRVNSSNSNYNLNNSINSSSEQNLSSCSPNNRRSCEKSLQQLTQVVAPHLAADSTNSATLLANRQVAYLNPDKSQQVHIKQEPQSQSHLPVSTYIIRRTSPSPPPQQQGNNHYQQHFTINANKLDTTNINQHVYASIAQAVNRNNAKSSQSNTNSTNSNSRNSTTGQTIRTSPSSLHKQSPVQGRQLNGMSPLRSRKIEYEKYHISGGGSSSLLHSRSQSRENTMNMMASIIDTKGVEISERTKASLTKAAMQVREMSLVRDKTTFNKHYVSMGKDKSSESPFRKSRLLSRCGTVVSKTESAQERDGEEEEKQADDEHEEDFLSLSENRLVSLRECSFKDDAPSRWLTSPWN